MNKTPEERAREAAWECISPIGKAYEQKYGKIMPPEKVFDFYYPIILSAIQAATGELEKEVTDLEVRLAACHNQMTNDANGILADSKRIKELEKALKPFADHWEEAKHIHPYDEMGSKISHDDIDFRAAAETLDTPSPGREDK